MIVGPIAQQFLIQWVKTWFQFVNGANDDLEIIQEHSFVTKPKISTEKNLGSLFDDATVPAGDNNW